MKEDYNLFVPTIEEYFKGKVIYGRRVEAIRVSLSEVKPKRLCGLVREKAIYNVSIIDGLDEFTSIRMFMELKMGKLIVSKDNDKLLADLMTRYKTLGGDESKLTLENSFVIPLNEVQQ